jgi:hypothetical protein
MYRVSRKEVPSLIGFLEGDVPEK